MPRPVHDLILESEIPFDVAKKRLADAVGRDMGLDILSAASSPTSSVVGSVRNGAVRLHVNHGFTHSAAPELIGRLIPLESGVRIEGAYRLRPAVRATFIGMAAVAGCMLAGFLVASLVGQIGVEEAVEFLAPLSACLGAFALAFWLFALRARKRDAAVIEGVLRSALDVRTGQPQHDIVVPHPSLGTDDIASGGGEQ